jgi:hypothetical protein
VRGRLPGMPTGKAVRVSQRRRDRDTEPRSQDRAAAGVGDEMRAWVVWGVGALPERAAEPEGADLPGEQAGDIARTMADRSDPEWARLPSDDKWAVIVEADEQDVDAWVQDDEAARGYAPYLVAREDAAATPEIQRGVLRPDRVKRRKPKRFDAARPE